MKARPVATTRRRAPVRDVVRVIEVVGARGGVVLVHMLTCEHWVTSRKPQKEMPCIGCVVEQQLTSDREATRPGFSAPMIAAGMKICAHDGVTPNDSVAANRALDGEA